MPFWLLQKSLSCWPLADSSCPGTSPKGYPPPNTSPQPTCASQHSCVLIRSGRVTDLLLPQAKPPSSLTPGLPPPPPPHFPFPVHFMQQPDTVTAMIPISSRIKCKVLTQLPLWLHLSLVTHHSWAHWLLYSSNTKCMAPVPAGPAYIVLSWE